MAWLLALIPTALILWFHFRNQRKSEYLVRASNYWIIFYVLGYFPPILPFVAGEDAWTILWGYSFSNFDTSLTYAVLVATAGGLLLSLSAAPRRRRRLKPAKVVPMVAGLDPTKDQCYQLKWARVFMVTTVALGALFVGVELVGGLQELLANLGDRINLFAGLNAFFLPLYLLIGVCFALSAFRATGGKISARAEWAAIGITLPALLLLGSKSNIFILIVGIGIIKLISRGGIKLRWALAGAFLLANLLILYEFMFREALIIGLDPERLKPSAWFEYMIFQLTGNFMQIQNLTVLVEALPDVLPYSFGVTYIVFFSLIIPQSIIGIKPLGATGIYTLAFWPEVVARESTTMPPGLFGEAYLNFGLAGYLIGCILIGLLLRKIDRPFQSGKAMNSMDLVSIAAFGSMALHFIRGEFFAPFLILVGIFLGARIVLVTAPRRVGPVRRSRTPRTFSSPPPEPLAPEPDHG